MVYPAADLLPNGAFSVCGVLASGKKNYVGVGHGGLVNAVVPCFSMQAKHFLSSRV